jgi:hypothetical protein
MTPADTAELIRQFLGGDADAIARLADQARTSSDPRLLVAAALAGAGAPEVLTRAAAAAADTHDRQLVAIAAAYLDGNVDRAAALASDHLVDHPESLLVAWIAAAEPAAIRLAPAPAPNGPHHDQHHDQKETS